MPRSSGTYTLPAGNPVVTGTTITSTWANNTLSDMANELTNSLPRDGSAPPTANIPMGGFKLTGLAAGVAATDSATIGSPNFTGVPTAPTAALGTNTTQIATMAAVFAQAAASGAITLSARTSNTILAAADARTFIEVTANSFVQTITAPGTLGNGWWLFYKNSGSGQITHTPASGNIDGAASKIMYPGEAWIIQCDGTNFNIIRLDNGSYGYIYASEQRAAGSNSADTATAGATVTRSLNTFVTTMEDVSLGGNAITLAKPGTYLICARVPGGAANTVTGVVRHRATLYNGSATVLVGSVASAVGDGANNSPTTTYSTIVGQFTTTVSTVFTIRHSCATNNMSGGIAVNIGGEQEVYTQVEIWRLR